MTENTNPIKFTIMIEAITDDSDTELFEVTIRLRDELRDADVDSVEFVRNLSHPPAGSKVGDPITIGAIVLGASVAAIPNIILLIQNWLLRQKDQNIRVKIGEIELEVPRDATKAEIENLISIVQTIR